ncbi:MAG: hypothetical protein OXR73_21085 [Myxococcales bacterium]|nr:hypothetical protein [Myxococcales bacterium]
MGRTLVLSLALFLNLGGLAPPHAWAEPPSTGDPDSAGDPGSVKPDAQPKAPQDARPSETANPPASGEDRVNREALQLQAQQLEELLAGRLDPAVDERALLRFDLATLSPGLSRWIADLTGKQPPAGAIAERGEDAPRTTQPAQAASTGQPENLGAPPSRAEGPDPGSPGDYAKVGHRPTLEPHEARLYAALLSLAQLRPDQRSALLRKHAERRTKWRSEQTASERRKQALAGMRTRAQQLQAFMDGELDLALDPQALLKLDLWGWPSFRAPPEASEPTLPEQAEPPPKRRRRGRRRRKPPPEPEPQAAQPPPDPEWDKAMAELTAARFALLQLSPEARLQLLETHVQRQNVAKADEARAAREAADEAEQSAQAAAEARKRALRAAEQARTETQRVIAEEHARLLGIQEAQALFEAALSQRRASVQQRREVPVKWRMKVRALEGRSVLEGPRSIEADRIYNELVGDLRDVRQHLQQGLSALERGGQPVPSTSEDEIPDGTATPMLTELRNQLSLQAGRLDDQQHEQNWDEVMALYDDMLVLNSARLQLMAWLSPGVRGRYTGAGTEAVRQAYAEVQQIALTLRMKALTLPRTARQLRSDLATAPLQVIFGLLQFVVIVAVFRRWRKSANELLGGLRRRVLGITPPTHYAERTATALWYLMRIRKPVEILLVVALIVGLFGQTGEAMGLDYAWVVVAWWMTGSTAIRALDAIAARQHLRAGSSESAGLRIRSLRLVGMVIVGTGMVLSLFELGVGRGTVYQWVIRGCWLLSIPTLILLTRWWRSTVFERMKRRRDKKPIFDWICAEARGPRSYVRGAIGGAYLLGEGVWAWLVAQASEWEVSRRLLAYLFRTEAARQAEARGEASEGVPLDRSRSRSLHPESQAPHVLDEIAGNSVAELIEEIGSHACTLAVISGDRGAGKSVTLGRIAKHFGDDALALACPTTGLGGLLASMRKELKLDGRATDEQIVKAINQRGPTVVTIDDLQRVIRPAIGGLSDLDRLVYMARDTHEKISWVIAISTPAWSYVERARSERIAFDRVLNLRGWSEDQIGSLLRRFNEHAHVRPNFDGLVVARQLEDANEETTGRAERGYYRILWDYSGGNPGVALYWWQQSLYENELGDVSVRLFRPPDPWDLETVPLNVRFALRTILQLDWAHPRQLAESLEMAPAVVDEALRYAQGRGYLERKGERVRIAWHWLRAITVALKRQHLITA